MEVKVAFSTYALSKYLTTVSKNEHGNYLITVADKTLRINEQGEGIKAWHTGDNQTTSKIISESTIRILKIIIDSISDRSMVISIGERLIIKELEL